MNTLKKLYMFHTLIKINWNNLILSAYSIFLLAGLLTVASGSFLYEYYEITYPAGSHITKESGFNSYNTSFIPFAISIALVLLLSVNYFVSNKNNFFLIYYPHIKNFYLKYVYIVGYSLLTIIFILEIIKIINTGQSTLSCFYNYLYALIVLNIFLSLISDFKIFIIGQPILTIVLLIATYFINNTYNIRNIFEVGKPNISLVIVLVILIFLSYIISSNILKYSLKIKNYY